MSTETTVEMPKYRCHKEVWALKIARIDDDSKPNEETDGGRILVFEEPGYAPMRVTRDFIEKHGPYPSGYYVVYKDGYRSFSPCEAFEGGYTRI